MVRIRNICWSVGILAQSEPYGMLALAGLVSVVPFAAFIAVKQAAELENRPEASRKALSQWAFMPFFDELPCAGTFCVRLTP